MQSRYGAWDLVRAAGRIAGKGARAISPLARTTLPVGRGLWRLGWALWMLAPVPIIFIAHQESIFDPLKYGAIPVTDPFAKWTVPAEPQEWDAQGNPIPKEDIFDRIQKATNSALPPRANLPKLFLYSTLGLTGAFFLIQGGFSLVLWVFLGFRKN